MQRFRSKGRRGRRVASVVREIVSTELVARMSDPRLAFVTVTGVELSPDLRYADVQVSILGDEKKQADCFRAIRHAHGHLQEKVAEALVVKFCPTLRFHIDESVKRSVSLSAIIARARAEDEANRADRIRRGVEPPGDAPAVEESEPVADEDAGEELRDDFDEEDDEGPEGEDERGDLTGGPRDAPSEDEAPTS